MKEAVARALVFAACTLAATLLIDLALSLFYQAGPAEGRTRQFVAFRAALHGATFVLTALGAALGFAVSGVRHVATAHIAMLGAGFGAFALAATLTGVKLGGFAVIALVLVAGACAVAYFGARAIAAVDDQG